MEGIQNNEADSSRHRSNSSSSSKAVPEHNTSGFLWTKLRIFKHSSDCCQHQFLSPSSPSKPWFYALYFFFHVWQMRVVIVRSSDEKSILNFWFHFQMIRHIVSFLGLKEFFSKYEVHIGFNMCDVPFSPNKFCFCNIQHFFSSSTLLEFEVQIDKSWGFEICLRKIVKDAIVVTRFFFWGISSNASQKQAEAVLYSSSIWLLKVHRTSEYKSASLCCCSWNRVF